MQIVDYRKQKLRLTDKIYVSLLSRNLTVKDLIDKHYPIIKKMRERKQIKIHSDVMCYMIKIRIQREKTTPCVEPIYINEARKLLNNKR